MAYHSLYGRNVGWSPDTKALHVNGGIRFGMNNAANPKTATAVAGAATLNNYSGLITTEALTTAAGGTYVLTLTNNLAIAGAAVVMAIVQNGTNTTGQATIGTAKVTANGTIQITVQNIGAAAFNGTLQIGFMLLTL